MTKKKKKNCSITFTIYLPKRVNKVEKVIEVTTGKPDFKTYQVDETNYSLTIAKVQMTKEPIPGFGVTSSRIYFDRASVDHILRTISYDLVRVKDPDSMLLRVELKMKKSQDGSDNIRSILKKEMFKALSLQ